MIANRAGNTVWRNDNTEPFGDSVPNDNPSGLGAFDFPLRFPGQYFDQETNLAYNYFRDYDPSIGRYAQSDPIGLTGGLNTYLYVGGGPLAMVDPTGLLGCIYDPEYFDNTGCVLTSKIVKDRELTDWRNDLPIILDTWNVPLPEFVIGGRFPSKKGPPWKPDTGRTKDYVEVQLGFFNVERLYKSKGQ